MYKVIDMNRHQEDDTGRGKKKRAGKDMKERSGINCLALPTELALKLNVCISQKTNQIVGAEK